MRLRLIPPLPLLCAAAFLLFISPVSGQQETNSQRVLPLPQGNNNDLRRQMELLRQFQDLMTRRQISEKTQEQVNPTKEGAGEADPKQNPIPPNQLNQLNQLREAFEKFGGKLPSGLDPSVLKDIPQDKLQKAMQDPQIQQQVRSLLEQFSRDGVLPQNQQPGVSPLPVPIPNQDKTQNQPEGRERRGAKSRPDMKPSQPSDPSLPQSNRSEPSRPSRPSSDDSEKSGEQSKEDPGEKPDEETGGENSRAQPTEPGQTPQPATGESEPSQTGNRTLPNLQSGAERSRSPKPADNPKPADSTNEMRPSSDGPGTNLPEGLPSGTMPDLSKLRPETIEDLKGLFENLKQEAESPTSGSGSRSTPRGSQRNPAPNNVGAGDNQSSADLLRDLQESLPRNWTPPTSQRGNMPGMNPANQSGRQQSGQRPQQDSNSGGSLDIKRELERGDLENAFKRIVEQAREEDRQEQQRKLSQQEPAVDPSAGMEQRNPAAPERSTPSNQRGSAGNQSSSEPRRAMSGTENGSNGSRSMTSPQSPSGSTNGSGSLGDSAQRMADGMKNLATDPTSQDRLNKAISGIGSELREMAQEGRFERSGTGNGGGGSGNWGNGSGGSSGNSMNGMGNAASRMLERITTAPRSPMNSGGSSGGGMSMPSLPSPESASAMVWFLAAVFGMIALAGIALLMMRLGAPKLFDRLTMKPVAGLQIPSSIRNRQDVIKFFHAYALRPETSAESWWTHRRVEEEFKQQTPQQSRAVKTLADVYEQARYLPVEEPLPEEQLAAADRAMHEVGVVPK